MNSSHSWGEKGISNTATVLENWVKKLYGPVQNVAGEDGWISEVVVLAFLPYSSHTPAPHSHRFLLMAAGMGSENVYCDRTLRYLIFPAP